jgi:metal-responsive CopG/Arc/MetJ family transcriptional regulator
MKTKEKVTIMLPRDLMNEVRAIAPVRGYSQFIAEAIKFFIKERRQRELRDRLIEGYKANAQADADRAAEWSAIEDEALLMHVPLYDEEKPIHGTSH